MSAKMTAPFQVELLDCASHITILCRIGYLYPTSFDYGQCDTLPAVVVVCKCALSDLKLFQSSSVNVGVSQA